MTVTINNNSSSINNINNYSILSSKFYSIHFSISQNDTKTRIFLRNFKNRSLLCTARTPDVLVLVLLLRVMSRNCVCNTRPFRPTYGLST
jgi:hypothetical protein